MVASSPLMDPAGESKKTEKRGIGLGYGLSGLGFGSPLTYTSSGYHPAGYVAPLATTTVIKSGYTGIPASSAGYTGYSGFYPGYTTGYNALGYGGLPAAVGTSYAGKFVQPAATATYSKVIHSYPHYGTSVAAVSPALGYTGISGYHGGYVY
ncbi:prisilkin-39-like isoform X2 [Toxorhynchites rutilus septentrionalis]|nr:prisilkin-39-like isoform X2 [Toxorhynchites rutilus septentrionalis]